MDKLTDFKPFKRVEVPDLGALSTSGLILIVGPNSSGKSQLLRDMYYRAIGEPRQLVVATDIAIERPEYPRFMEVLEADGYIQSFEDDSGTTQIKPLTTFLGTGEAVALIPKHNADSWFQGYSTGGLDPRRRRSDFLTYFGRLLVTALFLDRRLAATAQVGMFDFETQHPQTDLHALYVDDDAKARLLDESVASFGKAVWPDSSRGSVLCLRVSDQGQLPSAEQRLSPRAMSRFRTIENEGDGMKSYVATCIALLLGRRPVTIIDEPEMCLHPPQAYNLGRFIGRYGAAEETATFVATHSSHLLRGVIQTAPSVQIVRLTRRGAAFHAHLVPPAVLAESLRKPTVRAESILDGIFAQAVVVLEADTDRTVYQAAWETLGDEVRLDIHFAPVGGVGGIADTCELYRTLRIPVAVIADLDLLTDPQRTKRVLESLSTDTACIEQLCASVSDISERVRELPPTISPSEVREQLKSALESEMNWIDGDDDNLRRQLSQVAQSLDRMRRVKKGGIAVLPAPLGDEVSALLVNLAKVGLFLVPVGELEEWLANAGITASKASKWAWANEAAQKVSQLGPLQGDVWGFIRGVGDYLADQTLK